MASNLELYVFRALEMESRLKAGKGNVLRTFQLESGNTATAMNPHTKAVGLGQLMPSNLKGVGFLGSPEDFASLTEVQQLPYFERFLGGKDLSTVRQTYVSIFMPALNKQCADPSYVVMSPTVRSWAYEVNKTLDEDGNGVVTAGELEQAVYRHCRGERWKEICKWAGLTYEEPASLVGTTFWLQSALQALGFYVGQVDGIVGPKTYAAVKAFQTAKGLKVDGIPGPKTVEALKRG